MVTIADVVDQQPQRPVVVGDDDVGVAVVVEVAEGRAPTDLRQPECGARRRRHVLEAAVPKVAKQLLALMQWKRIARLRERLDGLHRAVDGQQIEPAVVVVVEPGRAKAGVAQAGRGEPRLRAPVLERARPVVDVEIVTLARLLGDEEVVVAVVVEIAGVHAHAGFGLAFLRQRHARRQRRVPERAVVLVDPELIGLAVVGDVEVDPSVAVEDRPSSHRAPVRIRWRCRPSR